jgi:hypothetical protein
MAAQVVYLVLEGQRDPQIADLRLDLGQAPKGRLQEPARAEKEACRRFRAAAGACDGAFWSTEV